MANVLDPVFMTAVVQNIRTDITSFRGAQLLTGGVELQEELGNTIEYDITFDETGMTPPTGLNDESPIRKHTVVQHMNFTNQEWREKKIIDRDLISKLREPGNRLEQRWGENFMIKALIDLNQRLETRFEWMRWTCLSGSLLVPATTNKPAFTINYNVPASQKPVAANLWSDSANSDPLADIKSWKLKYRGTGARPKKLLVNELVDGYLLQNQKIRDLLKTQYGLEVLTADTLNLVMTKVCGLEYEVYDEGYIDDSGNFYPFIPDNVAIIVGEGVTGTMMDLVTSPNNYEDLFKGETGKFALMKEIEGDPKQFSAVNGATVLPRLKHVNWHIYATVA